MAFLVGIVLAVLVGLFASWTGLDRSRAFYPTVLIVVASYYLLFAVMGGSNVDLVGESLAGGVFVVVAVAGFKRSLWLVVAGLAGHGLFDLFHGSVIANPGVPAWWPGFCLGYDLAAAGCLAWLLTRRRVGADAR